MEPSLKQIQNIPPKNIQVQKNGVSSQKQLGTTKSSEVNYNINLINIIKQSEKTKKTLQNAMEVLQTQGKSINLVVAQQQNQQISPQEIELIELYFRTRRASLYSNVLQYLEIKGLFQGKIKFLYDFVKLQNNSVKNNQQRGMQEQQILLMQQIVKELKNVQNTKMKAKYRYLVDYKNVNNFISDAIENEINVGSRNVTQFVNKQFIESILHDDCEEKYRQEFKKKDMMQIQKQQISRQKQQQKQQQNIQQKRFIVIGDLPDIRDAMLRRGWTELQDENSLNFDFKWTIKKKNINFVNLMENQIINHFLKMNCISTKNGLCRNLRDIVCSNTQLNPDIYYPKCYDISDATEFVDFIEEFKYYEAYKILQGFISSISQVEQQFNYDVVKCFQNYEKIFQICVNIIMRHTQNVENVIQQMIQEVNVFLDKRIKEWELIAKFKDNQALQIIEQVCKNSVNSEQGIQVNEYSNRIKNFIETVSKLLEKVVEIDPQISLLSGQNIWIMKPGSLSRGRGIICLNDLRDIHYCLKMTKVQWVCQKYIENPLLIKSKKFDIRQWILVTDWQPLTVWFYDECYIRFGAESYDENNLQNRFVHLTNNSIAKYSDQFGLSEIKENMWSQQDFAQYLQNQEGREIFYSEIQQKLKQIVNSVLQCAIDNVEQRKNTFELYGFDFMIDTFYKPWLIEINTSPDMSYSTEVTKRIVQMASEDIVKVVIDYKHGETKSNVDTGNFKCIYKGKSLL